MNDYDLGSSDGLTQARRPSLDPTTGILSIGHDGFPLTKAEQAVFARLVQSPGQVLSRERLYGALYDMRADSDCPEPKIIDVFICRLRHKLARIGFTGIIETVRGHGFRFNGPAPAIALSLTTNEWQSLHVVVAVAERQNIAAAATIRDALRRFGL